MTFSPDETPPVNPSAEVIARALACGLPRCPCGKRSGKEWVTHCPTHDDPDPSLNITEGDGGKLLVRCRAGCSQDAVITALSERTLWPEASHRLQRLTVGELARAKGLSADFLRSLGVRDFTHKVRIPYLDTNGQEAAVRFRHSLDGVPRFTWRRGDKAIPYGLWRLAEARRFGSLVLAEGESDCWTLWGADIPALGVPGASTWRPEWVDLFQGLKVFLWREPDAGGDSLASRVVQSLPEAYIIQAPPEKKDPNELWLAVGRDPTSFRQRMQELIAWARPASELQAEVAGREAQEALEKARQLLEDPDLIQRMVDAIRQLGYAGDPRPVVLAYEAITSRLLPRPMNLAFVAPSAAGKNRTVDDALALMPNTAFYLIGASSPRALVYTDADFRHRSVVIAEADSIPDEGPAASAVRSLAEDNVMRYEVVEKDPSGQFRTRRVEKPGPTGLITTSTRPVADQMGTRTLEVGITDTPEQTRAILQAHAATARGSRTSLDTAPFKAMQRWLELAGERDVVVPFASRLANLVPADMVRMRRDFPQLLTLVKANALLHQRQRPRDNEGRVVATVEDYRLARWLLDEVFTAAATGGVTEAVRETVEAVEAIRNGEAPVTVSALAGRLHLHRTTAYRRAIAGCSLGYLVNEETRPNRPLLLRPGEPLPEKVSALPDIEDLTPPEVTATVQPLHEDHIYTVSETVVAAYTTMNATATADIDTDTAVVDGCMVAEEAGGRDPVPCVHRPSGEVEDRWTRGVGGDDPHACRCCGGPVRPDLWEDGLCPVCRNGRPAKEGCGHLVRLALDLGAREVRR